jgi:hypothetical protein
MTYSFNWLKFNYALIIYFIHLQEINTASIEIFNPS